MRLLSHGPEPCASANSAISARLSQNDFIILQQLSRIVKSFFLIFLNFLRGAKTGVQFFAANFGYNMFINLKKRRKYGDLSKFFSKKVLTNIVFRAIMLQNCYRCISEILLQRNGRFNILRFQVFSGKLGVLA